MDFYNRRSFDPSGGMYHFYLDDGTVYDAHTRHLVSATRFVVTNAMLYRESGEAPYLSNARHAVDFVRDAFRDPQTGGYAWLIDWRNGRSTVLDSTRHCYGMASSMPHIAACA